MLYLYAIADDDGDPPETPGIHGAGVRAVSAGGLCALVSEHEELGHLTELDELWAHEGVVEAVAGEGRAVLPMRLGSTLPGTAEVEELLRERREDFERGLERVRGAVELGVRAVVADQDESADGEQAPDPAGGPGTTYLMSRLAAKRRAEEVAAALDSALGALARGRARLGSSVADGGALRFAYLVDSDRVGEFRDRVDSLVEELEGAEIVCTGPWPPYSFTGSEEP